MSYDPWGVPTQMVGVSSSSVFGFNGEEYSPVTGLQYLRARWYEPTTGRFPSADALFGDVGQPKSLNRYSYAWDDALNLIDPSGYAPIFGDPWANGFSGTRQTSSPAAPTGSVVATVDSCVT